MTERRSRRKQSETPQRLPLLPLRDVVLLPGAVVPLLVGREKSIRSLSVAAEADKLLIVAAQRDPEITEPTEDDVYRTGTISRIHQMLRLPDGTTKILVEGLQRAHLAGFVDRRGHLEALIEAFETTGEEDPTELEAASRQLEELFNTYVQLNRRLPEEVAVTVSHIEEPQRRADTIAAYLTVKPSAKQDFLSESDVSRRLRRLIDLLHREIEILRVEQRIDGEVKQQVEQNQKEAYLNERLRAIRKEFGYGE
jgi:ATP-dependent Lon protease